MRNELDIMRSDGSVIHIDFTDREDILVDFDVDNPILDEEKEELQSLMDVLLETDFSELNLKYLVPMEMKQLIGDDVYKLDLDIGTLMLIGSNLLFMSAEAMNNLTLTRSATIRSNIGDIITLNEDVMMEVGGFKIPYLFHDEFLIEEDITRVILTESYIPLSSVTSTGVFYTTMHNSSGLTIVFSRSPETSYTVHRHSYASQHDSLIEILDFLNIIDKETLLEILNTN